MWQSHVTQKPTNDYYYTNSNIINNLEDAFNTLFINNNSDNNNKENEPNEFSAPFFFILINTLLTNFTPLLNSTPRFI